VANTTMRAMSGGSVGAVAKAISRPCALARPAGRERGVAAPFEFGELSQRARLGEIAAFAAARLATSARRKPASASVACTLEQLAGEACARQSCGWRIDRKDLAKVRELRRAEHSIHASSDSSRVATPAARRPEPQVDPRATPRGRPTRPARARGLRRERLAQPPARLARRHYDEQRVQVQRASARPALAPAMRALPRKRLGPREHVQAGRWHRGETTAGPMINTAEPPGVSTPESGGKSETRNPKIRNNPRIG